ncbi:MAG: glycosyltransferase family 4 protein [Marinosulfonomonas sp.]|nr:glycosyltransferase family 4 protein [Marinosulfonomonas sp.]
MRVLLLSKYDRLGASSRVRSFQYLPFLRERGWHIDVSPLFCDDYVSALYEKRDRRRFLARGYLKRFFILFTAWKYDVLWIEKELFPYIPAWGEWFLARFGVRYVVDYDDAVFHCYDNHKRNIIRLVLGRKIDKVMRLAATVTVGNAYLAAKAHTAGVDRVVIIPTVIDRNRYRATQNPKEGPVTIGWIGSPGTSAYLLTVAKALRTAVLRHGVQIVAIGADPNHAESILAKSVPWCEADEINAIQTFDIGIMPVPDEPFERGKCGYKLIQYMACGLPVVASPVGVNAQIVEHGVNGFLASTDAEWDEALSKLINDPKLRETMGRAGRKKVEQEYSLQVQSFKVLQIIRDSK